MTHSQRERVAREIECVESIAQHEFRTGAKLFSCVFCEAAATLTLHLPGGLKSDRPRSKVFAAGVCGVSDNFRKVIAVEEASDWDGSV